MIFATDRKLIQLLEMLAEQMLKPKPIPTPAGPSEEVSPISGLLFAPISMDC